MVPSPSRSPRLPSPPPIAEDQLGAKSPIGSLSNEHGQLGAGSFDEGASRRIRPGTKAADMPEGPALVPLKNIDTAFQLTEHLKALYSDAIHPDGLNTVVPIDRVTATRLAQPPDGVDKSMWLYELCRFLVQKINAVIVALFNDGPPCSRDTCTEMRASEWQYLCAVHDPPKACCAIDYCCHTLDWASNTLTSPKNFPSRMSLTTENGSNNQQMRQLTNIFRRVYRIFAHAWFQHRAAFWEVESKGGLYVFFKTVCDIYNLIPAENYTVPPGAEGIETTPIAPPRHQPTIMKKSPTGKEASRGESPFVHLVPPTGHPTQRHRHSPSTDATSVPTVVEEPEEEVEKGSMQTEELDLTEVASDVGAHTSNEDVLAEEPINTSNQDSAESMMEPTTENISIPETSVNSVLAQSEMDEETDLDMELAKEAAIDAAKIEDEKNAKDLETQNEDGSADRPTTFSEQVSKSTAITTDLPDVAPASSMIEDHPELLKTTALKNVEDESEAKPEVEKVPEAKEKPNTPASSKIPRKVEKLASPITKVSAAYKAKSLKEEEETTGEAIAIVDPDAEAGEAPKSHFE